MKKHMFYLGATALILLASTAEARRGAPPHSLAHGASDFTAMDHQVLPTPNLDEIFRKETHRLGGPVQISETFAYGRSMDEVGTWTSLAGGAKLWQLRVTVPGAYFLGFELSNFELPPGATLHFLSVEREFFDGPYTHAFYSPERFLGSPIIPDDSALIEVYLPAGAAFVPNFMIDAISFGYKNFRNVLAVPRRDGRAVQLPEKVRPAFRRKACQVQVNCPEGDGWELEKRSVAEAWDGNFICSGSVLNTTRNDCSEYNYMSANHCFSSGKAKRLVFFWNYEDSACGLNDAPLDQTTTGSVHLASGPSSDFFLVRLTEIPPESFFVSQSGWDATGATPQSGTTIGHPNDRPKEISHKFSPLRDGQSDGWGNDHWRVDGWDLGGTETGSSGGALWDENHRHVGQLHGGAGSCGDGWDEFGKLSVSWGQGVSSALDPDGTGALVMDGIDCFGGTPPPPPPACELGQPGDSCTDGSECCSGNCKGKSGSKTCK